MRDSHRLHINLIATKMNGGNAIILDIFPEPSRTRSVADLRILLALDIAVAAARIGFSAFAANNG